MATAASTRDGDDTDDKLLSMTNLRLSVDEDQGAPAAASRARGSATPRSTSSRPYSCGAASSVSSTAASQAASRASAYSRAASLVNGWKKNSSSASAGTQPRRRSARLMCTSS